MSTNTIRAIIVDDEAGARSSLSELITQFCPGVDIAAQSANVDEAVIQINKHQPDVVFSGYRDA